MKSFLAHVTRWPLLFGAVICLTLGVVIADSSGAYELVIGILVTLGALLLGAWLWALATHTNPDHRSGDGPSTD